MVGNKLTAALVVLRELENGRIVPHKLIERAIRDLRGVMSFVDRRKAK